MSNQAITGIPIHHDTNGFNFAGREEYPSAKGEILYPHAVVLNDDSDGYDKEIVWGNQGNKIGRFSGIQPHNRHEGTRATVDSYYTGLEKTEAVLEGACLSRLFRGETHDSHHTGVRKPIECQWIDVTSGRNYFANVAKFSDKCGILASKGTHRLFDNAATRIFLPFLPPLGIPVGIVARIIGQVLGAGAQIVSHVVVAAIVIGVVVTVFFTAVGLAATAGTLFLLTSPVIAYMNKNSFEIKELKGMFKGLAQAYLSAEVAEDKNKVMIAVELMGQHKASQDHRSANYWYGDGTLFKIDDASHGHIVNKLLEGEIGTRDIKAEYIAEKKALNMAVNLAAVGTVSLFPAAKQKVRDAALRVMEGENKLPSQIEDFAKKIAAEMENGLPPKLAVQPSVLTTEDGYGNYQSVKMLGEDDDEFGDFEDASNSLQMTAFGTPHVAQAAGNGYTNPLLRSTSDSFKEV